VEWNISHIRADLAWSAGFTGQGVVIGGQDTGYDWDHPALINQYRGWDGSTANHNYNWHDAIDVSNASCLGNSPEPCDDYSHGTHTMGTMVGNDLAPSVDGWPGAAANAVGVAPGAQWIGCRNMNNGNGTPASYTECYEWFVAPYPLGSTNPMTDGDPSKAPHVINNSWSCPPEEGCSPDILEAVVNTVRAAGIVTVHSAGNSGPGCGTVNNPAATYPASFTVAATDSNDNIASFSSRGPSTFDGGLKPDISAPGVGIRSTLRNGVYGNNSGTSMAAPHVAGLVALLISANPTLAGDVDAIETILRETAVPLTTSQGCGGDGPTDVPNHVFGYGRIDALALILQQFPLKLYLPFSVRE
jgi:subtilisin family serine protease